jgi:archaellum component FlaC
MGNSKNDPLPNPKPDTGEAIPADQKKFILKMLNSWWVWRLVMPGIGLIFLSLCGWTFTTLLSVSRATAKLEEVPTRLSEIEKRIGEAQVGLGTIARVQKEIEGITRRMDETRDQLASVKASTDGLKDAEAKVREISNQVASANQLLVDQKKSAKEMDATLKALAADLGKTLADLDAIDKKVAGLRISPAPTKRISLQVMLPEKPNGEADGFYRYECRIPKMVYGGGTAVERVEIRLKDESIPYAVRAEIVPEKYTLNVFVQTDKPKEFNDALVKGVVANVILISQ